MRALLCVALLIFLAGCEQPTTSTPHILAFHAEWCGPCQRNEPQLQQIEAAGYSVTRIDYDQQPAEHQRYGVRKLPTYILYRDGQQRLRTNDIHEIIGAL